jgi:hypothetical protein
MGLRDRAKTVLIRNSEGATTLVEWVQWYPDLREVLRTHCSAYRMSNELVGRENPSISRIHSMGRIKGRKSEEEEVGCIA